MSRCVVTGAAGFIGSHLSEALIEKGHDVVGLDAFIPYYPRPLKEQNLAGLLSSARFNFVELDFRTAELAEHLEGADVVFHLGAMAGLMKSWTDFQLYSSCNAEGTQRMLEAAMNTKVGQFIHISTSSVYGKEATGPESTTLSPFSPYGITKLAAEQLCRAYKANFDVPYTILRYFSVYGPRQRPDMAYNILIRNLLEERTFTMFGDGEQTRSNTYIADCVRATIMAFEQQESTLGQVFNIGGGEIKSLNEAIAILEELTGRTAKIDRKPARPGDQKHTAADIGKARGVLGYEPQTSLRDGLRAQVEWQTPLIHATE